eukprot:SAG31_NODE_9505_length_1267_cov_1.342466_2_plen_81_part_00
MESSFEDGFQTDKLRAQASGALQKSFAASAQLYMEEDGTSRYKKECCGLLHPDTTSRHVYDLVQLFIMIWLGYALPIRLV